MRAGRVLTVVAFLLAAVALPVAAAQWVLLGERTVAFAVDHDVIVVGRVEGTFTAIKLAVKRAGVEILDLKVHFGDGSTQDVQVRAFVPVGGASRVIDLEGGGRVVRRVDFTYRSGTGTGKHALVRLFGRR